VTPALGGPGLGCSATRVRRLEAGELAGPDRALAAAHLAECARCRATADEIAREREALAASLPFDAFAAGVAERLAAAGLAPRRPFLRRAAPLALAASLLVAVGAALVLRPARDDGTSRIDGTGGIKGAAALSVYVRAGDAARLLARDEVVPSGAALRVALDPAKRAFAAVALLDADGAALLYAGAARKGLLPGGFEWTGSGPGTLVAVFDDSPVDGDALARRLAAGGPSSASPGRDAEVVIVPLSRGLR
jgi:hypothetical protein